MEAIDILKKYSIQDNRKNLINNFNYTWSNTPDRTEFSLEKSIERFNTFEIEHALFSMIENNLIKEDFTILDLFGGTGAVLYLINKRFPKCNIIGVDLLYHNSWGEIKTKVPNANFFQIDFFELKEEPLFLNLDILITFNTFRGWDNSVGPFINQNYTKTQFSRWAKNNFNYFITDRGDVENYFDLLPFEPNFNNLKVASTK